MMPLTTNRVKVYLEIGKTRAFATAYDWPGWCRSGRDEAAALQALCESAPRYASAMQTVQLEFHTPADISSLAVVERLEGNATTDFGAPGIPPPADSQPVEAADLNRMQLMLEASWNTFDLTVKSAAGKTLRKGPRGGGRDLAKIIDHVREVEISYLSILGGKFNPDEGNDPSQMALQIRQAIRSTLIAAAQGEIPAYGPRGGSRWTPRYFVRRLAWHELDHAWEIEDRVE
jgi:hypothetical protein